MNPIIELIMRIKSLQMRCNENGIPASRSPTHVSGANKRRFAQILKMKQTNHNLADQKKGKKKKLKTSLI